MPFRRSVPRRRQRWLQVAQPVFGARGSYEPGVADSLSPGTCRDSELFPQDRLAALRRLALPSQLSEEVRRRGVHSAKATG